MNRVFAFCYTSVVAAVATLLLTMSTPLAQAENSSLYKVDLDVKSTVMLRADLDQLGWYYHIDKTACICWVGGKSAVESAPSVFDCRRLAAHPALASQVKHCTTEPNAAPVSAASKETTATPEASEAQKDEAKK